MRQALIIGLRLEPTPHDRGSGWGTMANIRKRKAGAMATNQARLRTWCEHSQGAHRHRIHAPSNRSCTSLSLWSQTCHLLDAVRPSIPAPLTFDAPPKMLSCPGLRPRPPAPDRFSAGRWWGSCRPTHQAAGGMRLRSLDAPGHADRRGNDERVSLEGWLMRSLVCRQVCRWSEGPAPDPFARMASHVTWIGADLGVRTATSLTQGGIEHTLLRKLRSVLRKLNGPLHGRSLSLGGPHPELRFSWGLWLENSQAARLSWCSNSRARSGASQWH